MNPPLASMDALIYDAPLVVMLAESLWDRFSTLFGTALSVLPTENDLM